MKAGDEAGSALVTALPGLPGHLCPTAGKMRNLFTCLHRTVSSWGGELGDSSHPHGPAQGLVQIRVDSII